MIDIYAAFSLRMRANLFGQRRPLAMCLSNYFSSAGIQQWAHRRIEATARRKSNSAIQRKSNYNKLVNEKTDLF
jgi:hypothetical protein